MTFVCTSLTAKMTKAGGPQHHIPNTSMCFSVISALILSVICTAYLHSKDVALQRRGRHSQCDKGRVWIDHYVCHTPQHTPFVQHLLSCCAAVPGLLVYFVNVYVGQLAHTAVMDSIVPVINTYDRLSSPWADS